MSQRQICIHGHFYQPPRENPWLEAIEQQDSAYPYHDWNQRVNAESYGPNGRARILDAQDRITRIVNNYASISFDFGPTLLSWLQEHASETYRAVLDADRIAVERLNGHGGAMAQAYNHVIMPLANARDRRTQVVWGQRDFAYRFGRRAEGMWLPETAVDIPSLEELAEHGVRFTVLAPHQAAAVRPIGGREWTQLPGDGIDITRPYLCRLPSGREIALFFYDGPGSRAVAFDDLLKNGERFANRLVGLFRPDNRAQLVHIATDGETYGHHHRHGEMALAYALQYLEQNQLADITNYSAFLAAHEPEFEVRIAEHTSWSCAHGVERWRSDCGCSTGGRDGWHQAWRAPLRAALDWLVEEITPAFERVAGQLYGDPWAARDDYIDVILSRDANLLPFMARHARGDLSDVERVHAVEAMELQRHALLMYTSCGWFFNEVSGIETAQVLQYAGRAIQLAESMLGLRLEADFMQRLEQAPSNLPEQANARHVYEQHVLPARVDLLNVAAHYAVNSLFADQPQQERIYCYQVSLEHGETQRAGDTSLSVGRARVQSEVTTEAQVVTFAILHFGAHHLTGGIRRFAGDDEYHKLITELLRAFQNSDIAAVVRLLAHFPEYSFSLRSLFADRQREILYRLLQTSIRNAETAFQHVYRDNLPLTRFLVSQELPLPRVFTLAAEFVLNRELRSALESEEVDLERPHALLAEAQQLQVKVDRAGLGFALKRTLEELAERLSRDPHDLVTLQRLSRASGLAGTLPLDIDLWRAQNIFYELMRDVYPDYEARVSAGDLGARQWLELFTGVAAQLRLAVS
jgi:alpha-amylase/alpha-mannosidase (GH57 family)